MTKPISGRERKRAAQAGPSLGTQALARGLRDKGRLLRKLVIGEALGEPLSRTIGRRNRER